MAIFKRRDVPVITIVGPEFGVDDPNVRLRPTEPHIRVREAIAKRRATPSKSIRQTALRSF